MAPPLLKRKGNQTVRASDEQAVRLFGPHLFHFTTVEGGDGGPTQSASDQELAWIDHVFGSPSPAWSSTLITQWIYTNPILVSGPVQTLYLAHFDAMVTRATNANAYILFGWTDDNHNGTHRKLIDTGGRNALASLAARYAGNPAVLFAVQTEVPLANNATNWTNLINACNQAATQMRDAGYTGPVFIPGLAWSQRVERFPDNPVNDPNIIVKPHLYCGRTASSDVCSTFAMEDTIIAGGSQACFDAGYPIVVGECAIGGRSNETDLNIMMDHCEANGWGWQGWALDNRTTNRMIQSGTDIVNNLTFWGAYARDKSLHFASLTVPEEPTGPGTPPEVPIPSPSTVIIDDGIVNWLDTSWNTTVSAGASWVTVEHTASTGGFQMRAPGENQFGISTLDSMHILMHVTTAQLNGLALRVYQDHMGGVSTTLGPSLSPYATDQGDGWKLLTIPFSDFSFDSFDSLHLSRVELNNQSGAPMASYAMADWALVHVVTSTSLVMVVQPLTSPALQPIGGPPTVRALDESSNPKPGITVEASLPAGLNKSTFTTSSVTRKTTDADGLAAFDFLVVQEFFPEEPAKNQGYRIVFAKVSS